MIGWSIAGASLGDLVTYWIGRWIGPGIVHRYPLNRDKTTVARARLFFRQYGFRAIFIGRFLGPVRPTIPLVAGIMRMPHLNFQIANVTSAIVWVPFMLFWGILFKAVVGDLSALTTGHWIGLLLFLIAVMVGISWAVVKMQGKSAKQMRQEEAKRRAEWHKRHDKPEAPPHTAASLRQNPCRKRERTIPAAKDHRYLRPGRFHRSAYLYRIGAWAKRTQYL